MILVFMASSRLKSCDREKKFAWTHIDIQRLTIGDFAYIHNKSSANEKTSMIFQTLLLLVINCKCTVGRSTLLDKNRISICQEVNKLCAQYVQCIPFLCQ